MLLLTGIQAQTLVNRAWKTATGSPSLTYDHLAGATGSNFVVLVGNTYSPGEAENYLISKYSFTGQLLWQTEINSANNMSDIGFDVYLKGNNVFVTGTAIDSTELNSDILTLKLSLDSGIVQWDTTYAGAFGSNDGAIGIVADNSGNCYVLGFEATGILEAAMTIIKYNASGQQQWVSHYDSTAYISIAGALEIDDTTLIVTGVSGQGFADWHFVTLTASANTGNITNVRLDPNANGSLESLFSITQHSNGNTYIAGSTLRSPANEDIKIVRYDTLLNEVWVRTWGSADSLRDRPCKIGMGGNGHIIVLGETKKPNGGTDMVLLCYHNSNGNLLWERRLSAPNPAHECKPGDMLGQPFAGLGMPIYITGTVNNGSNKDYITASYDGSGNLRWGETFHDTLNSDDVALDIQFVGDGVIVSGVSKIDTVSKYVSVKYKEFSLSNTTVDDPLTEKPLYMANQVIVKFNKNAIERSAVDTKDLLYGNLDVFLKDWAVDSLGEKLPFNTRQCKLVKIFDGLKTTDTISISRLGEEVLIPDFWSTFLLTYPPSVISEIDLRDTLNQLFPFIEAVDLDVVAELTSTAPNDIAYFRQMSLSPVFEPTEDYRPWATINVEQAWEYTTGKPFVKVGIFDTGLYLDHQDFSFTGDTGTGGVAKGGWDFMHQRELGTHPNNTDYGMLMVLKWGASSALLEIIQLV